MPLLRRLKPEQSLVLTDAAGRELATVILRDIRGKTALLVVRAATSVTAWHEVAPPAPEPARAAP